MCSMTLQRLLSINFCVTLFILNWKYSCISPMLNKVVKSAHEILPFKILLKGVFQQQQSTEYFLESW